MENKYKIVIGDWSGDGHGRRDLFTFNCNKTDKEIKAAYLAAVQASGVAIHNWRGGETPKHQVLVAYQDDRICKEVEQALVGVGVDCSKFGDEWVEKDGSTSIMCQPEDVVILFLEMVKSQLPEFEYRIIGDNTTPCINGFFSKDFNYMIGYGVYDS